MADVPKNEQRDADSGRFNRRSVLKYGGASAATVGLAGCQSPENPVDAANVRNRDDDEEEVVGPDNGDEDAVLSGETIDIGVLAPMNLPLGESMWNAARIAADQLNENGGVLGASVNVILGDTETSPGTAESEHQRLTVEEDVDITVGIFLGSGLLQTMPSIANQRRIHITTGSAAPVAGQLVSQSDSLGDTDDETGYEQFKYHFRAGPIHLLDLADAMLEFVENNKTDLGWERAALLTENLGEFDPYAERLQEQLDSVMDVAYEERPGGVSNWAPIYDEIESEDCDLAVIGMALGGTTAVNQWANQERDFEFGGIHVPSQAYEFWESTDGNVEWVWTMNAMTPQTENTPRTQEFVQDYIDEWDSVPIYTGPLTFDGINLFAQAVKETIEEEGLEEMPDSETIIPYMEEMTFTDGTILDEFQFTPPDADFAHEPQFTSVEETGIPVFQQWQMDEDNDPDYGTMHAFAPEQNQTAPYQRPEWMGGDDVDTA